MTRSVMVMQILTRCARCGALVEPCQMPSRTRGATVWSWSAVATCNVAASGTVAMDFASTSVLCPDCIGQLKAWLAGGQTEDLSIAEDIIRDMYAALGAKPHRKQACVYLSERNPFMCARCMEDPKQCVDEMFKDIRWRCAEIGIDLKEEADAKRWQGQPEQAD